MKLFNFATTLAAISASACAKTGHRDPALIDDNNFDDKISGSWHDFEPEYRQDDDYGDDFLSPSLEMKPQAVSVPQLHESMKSTSLYDDRPDYDYSGLNNYDDDYSMPPDDDDDGDDFLTMYNDDPKNELVAQLRGSMKSTYWYWGFF